MTWTTTPPTEPGYYWWRLDESHPMYVHDLKPNEIEIHRKYPDERSGLWWSKRIEPPDSEAQTLRDLMVTLTLSRPDDSMRMIRMPLPPPGKITAGAVNVRGFDTAQIVVLRRDLVEGDEDIIEAPPPEENAT